MRSAIIIATLCGLLAATAAQAQDQKPADTKPATTDCRLIRMTSLDITVTPDGMLVPVSVNGVVKNFKLDLASSSTYLGQDTADALKLPTSYLRKPIPFNGQQIRQNAAVEKFKIGLLGADNQTIPILPKNTLKAGEDGMLGAAVLADLDFELDFANHKLNLFRADHCPGQVVYWTTSPAAQIPFEYDASGHLIIAGLLDGKPLSVALSGDTTSLLPMAVAHDQFGLEESSPGMAAAPEGAGPVGIPASQTFNYRFKSLSTSGVTLSNPLLVVYGPNRMSPCNVRLKDPMERCAGQPDINLGLPELSKFHIYVSSKEKLIYLTAADQH